MVIEENTMMVKARCTFCKGVLPEFNSRNPPIEIFCRGCGAKTSGEEILKRFRERIASNAVKQ
jgi:hypothetical protein